MKHKFWLSHNRLSAFGVIGTSGNIARVSNAFEESQSPFGFWGDWNLYINNKTTISFVSVTIAFRLLG